MQILPELGDIVLEGDITAADDRQHDHNCRNPLATHGLPLPQNGASGAQYRSVIKKRREANHLRRAIEYDAIL
jgi:hypothetical protein